MPSILSGCLILLKLAMAVNDGLHTMLSNVYSVLENAMQSDQDREHVEESSTAPAFQRSKSQILDAFNRRRLNPAIYEQTDVLVSNLTPFQEITITNKDVEGRRKPTASPIKKYPCKWIVGDSSRDVESNVEKECLSTPSSESCSPSFVSLDDTEDQQSSKTDVCTQVEETKNDLCRDNSMDESMLTLEDASQTSASRASLSHSNNQSPLDSRFLKSLQERIRLASQHFHRASQSCLNVTQQSTKNIWGLTDSDSPDNGEKVQIDSPTFSPEVVSRKMFLAETTRLYDDFLNNYYACTDASTNLVKSLKSLRTKDSLSASHSNGNEQTFEDNFSPVTSPNSPPQTTSSNDSSMDSSAFEQETNSVSSTCSKHENNSNVPFLLKKDSWANMDDVLDFINLGSLQKLNEVSTDNTKSNIAPHSKECLTDSDSYNHIQPKEELFPFVNHLATGEHVFEVSNNYESSIKPNLSSRSLLVCEELDDSGDLEVLSLARVDDLTKVLQEVGATAELLGELNGVKNDILNDVSNARLNMGVSSAVEMKSNSTSDSKVWNLDNIPWNNLDTEEKKINYLNNVTDSYQKDIKNGNLLLDNVLSEDFEHLQKVILETITNAYKSKVDFNLIRTENICRDGLPLTDPGSDMPFKEATSNKDFCKSRISTNTSAVEELDAFGLPFFVKHECKVKNTEHVLRKSAPLEIVSETVFKDDLLDVEKNHSESLFAVDCRHNETSTPKRVETLEDQHWISINLSSESQTFEVTGQEAESCVSVNERQNPAITEEAKNASLACNEIKCTKDELICSPNASNVKNGIALEAKDWGDVNAEFYKSYLKCVSILNMCDDEAEDATMETKSDYKVSGEFCKGNSYAKETETLYESKEQLTESSKCNEVLLLESNKTSLDISEDGIKTYSAGNKDERESNMVHDKLNIDCSFSNRKNISTSGLKCDELSCKDKESADFSASENANCEVFSNEKCYLNSENSIDKTEVKIADCTQLKVFYKPEHASGPKEGFQSVSSDAVSLEQLLSSTNTVLVKAPSHAKSKKTSVCKKDILNKEFLSNNFDKEVELYLKCVEHKDINNVKPRKIELIDLTDDHSNYKSESEEQKLNSLQVSKLSVEETRSYAGKSTPQYNIELLQQREELESTLIYDNEDNETNSDLPPDDSKQNAEFKNETGVPMLLNCNENGILASNIEVNNTQTVENVLFVSERTT